MRNIISLLLTLMISSTTYAAIDIYEFSDPQLSSRFQKLIHELRCPKCQNQNLAGSNSVLSVDLKDIVYEKLNAGETDQQILDFMKQRYGEFILFKPEMKQDNLLLWFGPLAFLLGFMFLFYRWYINNRQVPEVAADENDLNAADKSKESDI